MESDFQHHHHFNFDHQQLHQKQMNSGGLTRYQSAPSSYFSGFLDRDFADEFLNRPTSPETERIFARFLAGSGGGGSGDNNTENVPTPDFVTVKQGSPVAEELPPQVSHHQQQQQQQQQQQPQITAAGNNNTTTRLQQQQQSNYSASQNFYQNQSKPPLPDQSSASVMDYRMVTDRLQRPPQPPVKSGGNNSNLVRHSSSPAGLFSNINIEMENGYAVLGMRDFGTATREPSYSAASRPPPPPPPAAAAAAAASGRMSPIAEMGNKENSSDNYGFPWDDASVMSPSVKRLTDEDRTFSGPIISDTQNVESGNRPPLLAHHLSLPKTSAEISAIEKFLQLQDSVPCKIRAKRGCATHPRSIAERVRRTKISERMRKLQDLVPNMDKQTNTSDMLDLAVDYIKDLQRQVKILSENRAKCTCASKHQQQQ